MSTVIRNRGLAGETLNGENTGLVSVEGGAVWFPGVTGNYLVVDESSAPAGDLEAVARAVRPVSGGGLRPLVSKWMSAGGERCWSLGVSNTGKLQTYIATDGTVTQAKTSATTVGIAEESQGWFRMVVTVSTSTIEWFWAPDSDSEPTSWTSLGTDTYTGTVLFASSAEHTVGSTQSDGTGEMGLGAIRHAIVRDGVGGATVLDVNMATDITDSDATSFTASSGQTVTVNRATTGPVTTLVPAGKTILVNPDSTDVLNRIDIPESTLLDITATDDLFMAGVWYGWNDDPSSGTMWTSNSRTSLYGMYGNATNGIYGYCDGVTTTSASRINNDRLTAGGMIFMLRDTVNNTMRTAVWTVADGFLDDWTGAITPASATANADGYLNLAYAPAFAVAMERKGVGIAAEYDDTTLAALAAYLLEEV